MKEYYIDRTITLSKNIGEVYVEFFCLYTGEDVRLVFNAFELLKDIPSLLTLAKEAHENDLEYLEQKWGDILKSKGIIIKKQ